MEPEINLNSYGAAYAVKSEPLSQHSKHSKTNYKMNKIISDDNTHFEREILSTPLTKSNNHRLFDNNSVHRDKQIGIETETSGVFSPKSHTQSSESQTKNILFDHKITSFTHTENLSEERQQLQRLFTLESTSYLSEDTVEVKSILVNRGVLTEKRKSSKSTKGTIKWQDSVQKRLNQQAQVSSILAAQLLMNRGSQIKHIHQILEAMQSDEIELEKDSHEDLFLLDQSGKNPFVQDLGTDILKKRESVELTSEQEDKLKELKHRIKLKNDKYFMKHFELNVLLSLIYKQLFKHLPDEPIHFVAEYIHHLNTHREEMILPTDIYVPFDIIQPSEELTMRAASQDDTEQVVDFARTLVEHCVNIASRGVPYVNVLSILESLLRTVSPSETDVNAINVVSGIIKSLITSVIETRTRDTERFTLEIVEAILNNVCPSVGRGSNTYFRILGSVELFVKGLVDNLFDKATTYFSQNESASNSQIEFIDPELLKV